MDESRLPRLSPNDPVSLLSDAARRRIDNAFSDGDLILAAAAASVEIQYLKESDRTLSLDDYRENGRGAGELAQANYEAVRIILSVTKNEFQSVVSRKQLRQILKEDLEFAVENRRLLESQRKLLWEELKLYRHDSEVETDVSGLRNPSVATAPSVAPLASVPTHPEIVLNSQVRHQRRAPQGDENKATKRQLFMKPHLAPCLRKPTMNAFAVGANIAQSSFSRWYRGLQSLNNENLDRLAEHLHVDKSTIPN